MKKILLIGGMVILGYFSKAQDAKEVPGEVKAKLSAKYPEAIVNKVDWDKTGQYYKAEFNSENKEYEVLFDEEGNWIKSEIKLDKIPTKVKDGLANSEFKSFNVKETEQIESPEMETKYKVDVMKEDQEFKVYLDDEGKVIKKIKS
jgi:hypothetical protein